jgi:hypothetical protein
MGRLRGTNDDYPASPPLPPGRSGAGRARCRLKRILSRAPERRRPRRRRPTAAGAGV